MFTIFFSVNPQHINACYVYMFGIKVDENVVKVENKRLESMMTTNPELRKKLQEAIRSDVWVARNAVVKNIAGVFKNGDPNEARRAVRNIVYEKVLGANLNIMDMKKGTAQWSYRQQERADAGIGLRKGRGGNRIQRSKDTARRQGYEGKARGMILRWVNDGNKEERKTRYGNRGAISPRDFFIPAASAALEVVSQHLAQIIDEEIARTFNENNNG